MSWDDDKALRAVGEVELRRGEQLALLPGVDAGRGTTERRARAQPHLHEDQRAPFVEDEVDLAEAAAPVGGHQCQSLPFEETQRQRLRALAIGAGGATRRTRVRADGARVTAIDARVAGEDTLADDVALELVDLGTDLLGRPPRLVANDRHRGAIGFDMHNETLRRAEARLGTTIRQAYGMTEASHQMASNALPPGKRKPGAVGLPAGVQLFSLLKANPDLLDLLATVRPPASSKVSRPGASR